METISQSISSKLQQPAGWWETHLLTISAARLRRYKRSPVKILWQNVCPIFGSSDVKSVRPVAFPEGRSEQKWCISIWFISFVHLHVFGPHSWSDPCVQIGSYWSDMLVRCPAMSQCAASDPRAGLRWLSPGPGSRLKVTRAFSQLWNCPRTRGLQTLLNPF